MMEVRYVTHSGDDLLVANAARRSFGVEHSEWSETPRAARGRSDRELVMDLAGDEHELPFRHPHVTLSCTAPLPVARQLGKHQVGFSWSEISRRYKTEGLTFHTIAEWRCVPEDRRQGSGFALHTGLQNRLLAMQIANINRCLNDYEEALTIGASPEQARFLLPQSMDIAWTWTGSLLAWATLYNRRRHPDAQAETRAFAEACATVIEPLFPVSWPALTRTEDRA